MTSPLKSPPPNSPLRTILIRNALTQEGQRDVLVQGNRITAIDTSLEYPAQIPANDYEEFDASGLLLWPGLVNTHHHLAQSILKGMPAGIDADLNGWLPAVPFAAWPHITPETMYAAARIGFAELLRAGCTTCADHHYLYDSTDNAMALEAALIQAASETGIRFVLCRGGATISGTHKGLAGRTGLTEGRDLWLQRMDATFHRHHDPAPDAMFRLVVAPTSVIHTTEPADLLEFGAFARARNLRRHSHLLEVQHDENMARVLRNLSAVEYADSVGWLGSDVWYAHLVHADPLAIQRLAGQRTGIAHCPVSNCRLGSGVAAVPAMAAAGMQVTIGVDGSGSAESGSMVNELMQTWLVHRAVGGPTATTAHQVLEWATAAGADLLDLDTGRLAVGACADLVFYRLDEPRFYGVWQQALAPVICGEPILAQRVMVNGRWVVDDGVVLGIDHDDLARSARRERERLQRILS